MFLLDNVNNSNPIIYILFALLFVVIISILLLLYLQNKEINNNVSQTSQPNNISPDSNNNITQLNDSPTDLQNLSKELEQLPKEHNVDYTEYEIEQEKTAIISYDELVKQSQNEQEINNTIVSNHNYHNEYQHEEDFLAQLKQLKNSLN